MESLRIGLIGTGYMGRVENDDHTQALLRFEAIEQSHAESRWVALD